MQLFETSSHFTTETSTQAIEDITRGQDRRYVYQKSDHPHQHLQGLGKPYVGTGSVQAAYDHRTQFAMTSYHGHYGILLGTKDQAARGVLRAEQNIVHTFRSDRPRLITGTLVSDRTLGNVRATCLRFIPNSPKRCRRAPLVR
ncbi:unnamed protein product [Schistocephalus solidus]|uniref:Outer membrane protein n=1 Tax=Schistocephalus solidus TaxID=70667 RepID=A0A183TCE0_SCHSO|nr:unnamed protein product [Schistocephalus solidus]